MRVALCISGQMRFLEKGFQKLKDNLILPNNCDVFIHSWFDDSMIGENYSSRWDYKVNQNITTDAINLYNPKLYKFEPPIDFNDKVDKYDEERVLGVYPRIIKTSHSMFYSIMKCNDLKLKYEQYNNFKYDCVVRARFDYNLNTKIDVSKLDLNNIYVNNGCTHEKLCVNDHIAISNSDNIDYYSDVFNNIDNIYNEGSRYNPEVILGRYIHKKLNVVEVNLNSNIIRK